MTSLGVWALTWVMIHRLISGGPLRSWLIARIGQQLFRAFFAVLSIGCLLGLANAYANIKPAGIGRSWWLLCVFALMQLLAGALIVAGLSTRSPATAGAENSVNDPDVVRGMVRVTRHPFLWGVLLWSVSHLLVRHDPAALLFFGSIGLVALTGTWSIDRKRRLALGAAWIDFSARTSSVPFLAIAAGRQPFIFSEIGAWRIAAAIMLWFAALWVQQY